MPVPRAGAYARGASAGTTKGPLEIMALVRSNLSDEVATDLRDRILSGRLRPNQKVPQDEIARTLDVSKLPVREALIRLESEGLVINIPRRGAFVAPLTPEDVLDSYAIYGLVSGYAARRAAERITHDEVEQLSSWADTMESSSDEDEQGRLNFEFHALINRVGGSRKLRSVLKGLYRNLPTNFFGVRWHWSDHAHSDHRKVIAALRTRDGELASQTMFEHLRRSGEHAVAMLTESGFWDDERLADQSRK
jgi:DNA-binding GntR family transcriptional regulator